MRWIVQPAVQFRRLPPYRAPTWSWAAVNGAVTRSLGNDTELIASARGFLATMKDPDWQYGEVIDAEAIVEGPLLVAEMSTTRSETPLGGYELSMIPKQGDNSSELQKVVVGEGVLDPCVLETGWPQSFFFCLGLAYNSGNDAATKIDGLLLLRSETDKYVRCGWFEGPEIFQQYAEKKLILLL